MPGPEAVSGACPSFVGEIRGGRWARAGGNVSIRNGGSVPRPRRAVKGVADAYYAPLFLTTLLFLVQ